MPIKPVVPAASPPPLAPYSPGARADNVRVKMRPERWLTTDYAKQFSV